MKVCHIASGDLWAGAEKVTYTLLKGLRSYPDLELSAIVFNEGILSTRIAELGVPMHVIREGDVSFPRLCVQFLNVVRTNRPVLLHSHRYKENILAFLSYAAGSNVKLVSTQHGMPEVYDASSRVGYRAKHRFNYWLLSKAFHSVVAVSRDIQEVFVEQYGFNPNKVRVIHNGIEIDHVLSAKPGRRPLVFGSAGRLSPVKDYSLLTEVVREICKRTDSVVFELAGDGPQRAQLQTLIDRYGLQRTFRLKGFVSDMLDFYRGLDCYITTSHHEGIPLSVLEAMSHGLPVIAPNVGGLREIIRDGVHGFLLTGRDPAEFADKCMILAGNEALRERMSLAAQERIVSAFSVVRMAHEYHSLYRNLAAL
jgi:glycosyltransferase involved in cell wall biosynthesis